MCISSCTTPQPKGTVSLLADLQHVAPAECTKANFAHYPDRLSLLPDGFYLLTIDAGAKAQLRNKADDGALYRNLRANALRCAPEK